MKNEVTSGYVVEGETVNPPRGQSVTLLGRTVCTTSTEAR